MNRLEPTLVRPEREEIDRRAEEYLARVRRRERRFDLVVAGALVVLGIALGVVTNFVGGGALIFTGLWLAWMRRSQ